MPRIEVGPLPHFRLTGAFDPRSGSVPTVSVNWYARGGIFDGSSIIGVGESGPEAVVPLSGSRMQPFADAVADGLGSGGTDLLLKRLHDDLTAIYEVIPEGLSERDLARKVRRYA